jgi:hypothetical protein
VRLYGLVQKILFCLLGYKKMKKESADEKIAPAVARCHAPRKTGRVLNKAMPMRFRKK